MKQKRKTAVFLALLLVAVFCLTGVEDRAEAANTNNVRYYYDQLSAEAKSVYDAMYGMYEQGILKTGTERYDLVANGHMTQDELAACEGKYDSLLKAFGAARDAFYADYPEIFYVDFSALSITVEGNEESGYRAYLGAKDEESVYFTKGFDGKEQVENAIKEQEAKINRIAGEAKKAETVKEQVIAAHDAILKDTVYKLETNCSEGNTGHIRTSYGALVKGESLCEGYARAVKSVLDAMGIKSVLVQGYYQESDGSRNLHMWNYVQIDGTWYGVDATANDGMEDGAASDTYLLADSSVMKEHHVPDGIMSPAGFLFTYPVLAGGSGDASSVGTTDSEGYKIVFDQDGLRVGYRSGTELEGETGVFKVSYKGLGYKDAVEKEGVYILSRFYQYVPATGEDEPGKWGYSDPTPFMMPQLKDALVIANSNSRLIEFAVTKMAPAGPLYGDDKLTAEELSRNWEFQGTEEDFLVSTGQLENPKGNYVPAPWATRLIPGNTGFLTMGNTYSITAVYDEQLEEYDGKKAGYKLTVKDGWSAAANSKIEKFSWDGDRTITFDFTPSEMLADNYATYEFEITGLRGKGSLKEPHSFTYDVKKKISICAYRPQGYYFNVGAKPQLLEPGDLSSKGWVLASGEKLEDVVSNVTIVASKPVLSVSEPDKNQKKEMLDKIKEEGDTVLQSATYNIDLMLCNKSIVSTGSSVRISVGFPEGYGADTEGVVYKAYHFIKKGGKIVDVEEIDCAVTQYGLVIACKSFSPYAVVAVKDDKAVKDVRKVLLLNSEGGEITGSDKICKLERDKSQTVTLKAKDGYCIKSVNLSGKELNVTDVRSMNVQLAFNDLAYDENILEVTFAVEKQKEETQEETGTSEKDSGGKVSAGTETTGKGSDEKGSAGNGSAGKASSSGGSGNGGSSGTSDKKQENVGAPSVPAADQSAPEQTIRSSETQAVSGKKQKPVTPSADQGGVAAERKPGEADGEGEMIASAEESGEGLVKESVTETVPQSAQKQQNKEMMSAYESGKSGENMGFWLIIAGILGFGLVELIGIAIAHAKGKF